MKLKTKHLLYAILIIGLMLTAKDYGAKQEHKRAVIRARQRAEYQVNEHRKKQYALLNKPLIEIAVSKMIDYINN